jgi:hypothetical protein
MSTPNEGLRSGPFRPSWRVAGLVLNGVRADIGKIAHHDEVDPTQTSVVS